MNNPLQLGTMPEPLRNNLIHLIKKSFETFDDVGLLIEQHGDKARDYSLGESMRDAKVIYRAFRSDHIRVFNGDEYPTIISEIQILKGPRGHAGKTAKFFKISLTVSQFKNKFPGYDLGNMVITVEPNGVELNTRYDKDLVLKEFLNKVFSVVCLNATSKNIAKLYITEQDENIIIELL